MAKPTRIVVHYDDGSQTEIPAAGVGSIFMNEAKAKKCGHNPPYGPPPHAAASATGTSASGGESADSGVTFAATESDENGESGDSGDNCYIVNGVIVCP